MREPRNESSGDRCQQSLGAIFEFQHSYFLYGDDAKCVGLFALRELDGS